MVTNLSTFVMSTLRLAADDPELAEATLRQALGQWTQRGFHIQHNEWFGAEVQIRMYRGDTRTPGTSSRLGTHRPWLDRT